MTKLTGLFLAVVFSFVFLSCPNEDATESFVLSSKAETGFPIPQDLMGMVHAGYGANDRLEEEYALLDEMGIVWMLRDFSWSAIQTGENTWNLTSFDTYTADAKAHNKKIMGLLAYDVGWIHGAKDAAAGTYDCGHTIEQVDSGIVAGQREVDAFCEYVRRTVLHYKGEVGAWCIWNEPNLSDRFWGGTPDEFFILTKAAAAALRGADPDAVIIGGALNTLADDDVWTKGLFESGAMNQVDHIAYHPYLTDAVTSSNRFNNFRNYVAGCNAGFADKIWITEVGYPMMGSYGTEVDEEDMPEMVTKTITLLAVGKAHRIFWYELFDHGAKGDPKDSEHWFGLVDKDTYNKKGGADGYQLCALNIPGKTWRSQYPLRSTKLSNYIKAYYFEGNGEHTLIVWNEVVVLPQRIKVTLPGTNQQVWDVRTGFPQSIGETSTYLLEGDKTLQFFTWQNSDPAKHPRISGD
jgi:hypothetical protein